MVSGTVVLQQALLAHGFPRDPELKWLWIWLYAAKISVAKCPVCSQRGGGLTLQSGASGSPRSLPRLRHLGALEGGRN
ncbi:hypothetical protein EYF80_015913 [Liparis tanakae]|uniref:Uncharacterized protein n=1 Tax=Liparis tanakae TaxID=230148 RepID=A0A4Z2I768_9TELE|nr:hypothetical protein EYF80_015913 [Liparis tanakae]